MSDKRQDSEPKGAGPWVQGGSALSGTGEGSIARPGDRQGGSASGLDDEPAMAGAVSAQAAGLGEGALPEGQGAHQPQTAPEPHSFGPAPDANPTPQEAVNNTGPTSKLGPGGDVADADAATR